MEIAIHHEEKTIKIFVEGISWQAVTNAFVAEWVNIYLLVYYTEKGSVYYDENITNENGKLKFSPEHLRVVDLLSQLRDMGLNEPCEAKFGNGRFHLNRKFDDAYVLTFFDELYADLFLAKIARNYFSGMTEKLKAGKPYATLGVNNDLVTSRTFDRFIERRFNRWHEIVVKEYENSQQSSE